MDREFVEAIHHPAPVEAAIRNYETAYRIQSAVPELCHLRGETAAIRRRYGFEAKNP